MPGWCPKHGWEFSWEGTTQCPACGAALVAEPPAGIDPVGEFVPEATAVGGSTRLGTFDRLVAPVLLDMLSERGIRSFEAPPLANPATRAWDPIGVDIWVEASRLSQAQEIARLELPVLLESAREDAAAGSAVEEDVEEDEDENDVEVVWAAFGWMERQPAKVLLELCAEEGIPARTEFPLDGPPPPWAGGYDRVAVEVESMYVGDTERLLEEVEERLEAGGVRWSDPLCDLSGP